MVYGPRTTYPYLPPTGNDVFKVLSKTISLNGDTITYSFSKCRIDAINGNTYSTSQSHCTLVVTECSVIGNFPYIGPLSFPPNKYGAYCSFNPNQGLLIAPIYGAGPYFSVYKFMNGLGLSRYSFHNELQPSFSSEYFNSNYIKQTNLDDDCDGLETILDTKTLHATSSNIVVAPNPFDDSFALTATDLSQGNWTVRITSALGVEVYSTALVISSSNQRLDLSNLPALTSGIYFLSLENDSQVYSQKIIKQ